LPTIPRPSILAASRRNDDADVDASSVKPEYPAVAIVLVNWNGWRDSIECINSVLAQSYPNFHIFIVDNDSTDGSVEEIEAWCANPCIDVMWREQEGVRRLTEQTAVASVTCRVVSRPQLALPAAPAGCRLTLIRSGGNLGFAGGCNVGIRAGSVEAFAFFWLLNTDTVVQHTALHALVARALVDERIGMVGSTIRYYGQPHIVQSLGGARLESATVTSRLIGEGRGLEAIPTDPEAVERQMAYVMGASMLVSSRFVNEVGLLQEDYFLYYEEIDWAMRGSRAFKLAYAPDSHVFHKSGASSSKIMPLFTSNLYYRNRLRFVSRFFPLRFNAARRGLAVELLRHVLRGRWGHAKVVALTLRDAPKLRVSRPSQPVELNTR
jgi:hypothetical protein